jgi:hypothetical protein
LSQQFVGNSKTYPLGAVIASKAFIFSKGGENKMPADKELQATLLKEIYELNARRRKLEDALRSLDAMNNSLQEAAALRDIDAHKNQRPLPAKFSSY